MAIIVSFSSHFDVQNIVTLKSTLRVTQDQRKWHFSIDRIRVPIRLSL